jgi:hypothetical protein
MLVVAAWLTLSLSAVPARAATSPAGHWEGKIRIPDHELGFTVDFDLGPKGEWIGSLSITGSSSVDVPLVKITVSDTAVQFVANLPGETSFVAGTLSSDARALAGNAEIPVTTVTIQANTLELDARSVGGRYRGTLGASGAIAGEWMEQQARIPLTFKRANRACHRRRRSISARKSWGGGASNSRGRASKG